MARAGRHDESTAGPTNGESVGAAGTINACGPTGAPAPRSNSITMQHKFDTPKDGDYARYVEALVRRSALELRVSPHQPGTMGGADPLSRPSPAPAVVRPAPTTAASATKPAHRAAPSAPSDKVQRAAAAATAVLQAARSGKVNELSADAKKWLTRIGVGALALVFLWPVIREFTRGMDGVEMLFFVAVALVVAARALFGRRS